MNASENFKKEYLEMFNIALTWTSDKAQARKMVEAWLSGKVLHDKKEMIWI